MYYTGSLAAGLPGTVREVPILHAGKTVENRGWLTRHLGKLLIHASKTRSSYDREAKLDWLKLYGVALPHWEDMVVGALVGVVDVVALDWPISTSLGWTNKSGRRWRSFCSETPSACFVAFARSQSSSTAPPLR